MTLLSFCCLRSLWCDTLVITMIIIDIIIIVIINIVIIIFISNRFFLVLIQIMFAFFWTNMQIDLIE